MGIGGRELRSARLENRQAKSVFEWNSWVAQPQLSAEARCPEYLVFGHLGLVFFLAIGPFLLFSAASLATHAASFESYNRKIAMLMSAIIRSLASTPMDWTEVAATTLTHSATPAF